MYYFDNKDRIKFGVSRDSTDGTAARYGLDGPGIESQWGARFATPLQTGPWAHPASYRGKSPNMGRFPNMRRCIISYQEVLRSLLKNVNDQAHENVHCN